MNKKKSARLFRLIVQGIPLAGVIGASFLHLQRFGNQFLLLITLVWIQVFMLVECSLVGK